MNDRQQSSARITTALAHYFVVAVLTLNADVTFADEQSESDALLDEIVAGSDANIALIQHGVARYSSKRWEYSLPRNSGSEVQTGRQAPIDGGKRQGPFAAEYTVRFDYPRVRYEWRGNGIIADDRATVVEECYVYDGHRLIDYKMPQFFAEQTAGRGGAERGPHRGVPNPNAHNVLIYAKREAGRRMLEPRRQIGSFSAGEEIRWLRNHPKASPKAVREPGGLLRFYDEGRGFRAERWVSPKQGYCLVKSKTWNPNFAEPVFVTEAKARKLENGAYVIEHSYKEGFIIPEGAAVMSPHQEEEITLQSIDLTTTPEETLFTLDGLDLPVGTKIQDKIEGRTYSYGGR